MSISIKAEKREAFGKNISRRLRKAGMIPAILYGANEATIPLIINKKDIFRILKLESGENTIFQVSFDSETRDAMIKELQRNPVTDELLHADLVHIAMDKLIRVSIPIVIVGDAVGVKTEGGFVDFTAREVEIECLPKDIPEHLTIDISGLHLRQSFKVASMVLPENIRVISDPETILVHIEVPAAEEELEAAEEEEVIAEEAEPEVIRKEKPEEEAEKEKRGEKKEERE